MAAGFYIMNDKNISTMLLPPIAEIKFVRMEKALEEIQAIACRVLRGRGIPGEAFKLAREVADIAIAARQ